MDSGISPFGEISSRPINVAFAPLNLFPEFAGWDSVLLDKSAVERAAPGKTGVESNLIDSQAELLR